MGMLHTHTHMDALGIISKHVVYRMPNGMMKDMVAISCLLDSFEKL